MKYPCKRLSQYKTTRIPERCKVRRKPGLEGAVSYDRGTSAFFHTLERVPHLPQKGEGHADRARLSLLDTFLSSKTNNTKMRACLVIFNAMKTGVVKIIARRLSWFKVSCLKSCQLMRDLLYVRCTNPSYTSILDSSPNTKNTSMVRSHEERRQFFEEPTQSRKSPSIL